MAAPTSVFAQTSDAARAAGRQLATDGVSAYEAGDYRTAVEKLERAYEAVKAPSIGLWSARALAKRGRLVQASERYLEVIRLDPKTGDEAVQREAQGNAKTEYDQLQLRIATFTLEVQQQAPGESLQVTLDGVALPSSLLGVAVPVDPGEHLIEVKQGARQGSAWARLKEGQREEVVVTLAASAKSPTKAAPTGPTLSPAAPPKALGTAPQPGHARAVPVGVWVGLGASGVALAVGAVTGVMAASKRSELSPRCPNDVCEPSDSDGVNQLSTLRTVSTVGVVLGAVGLAGTGVLWFTTRHEPAQAFVRANIGVASASLEGRF